MKVENRIEMLNIPEYIRCEICDRHFKTISPSHLKKHGISMIIYRERYPEALLMCKTSRLKLSKTKKKWRKEHPVEFTNYSMKEMRKKAKGKKTVNKKLKNAKIILNLPTHKKRYSQQAKELWKNPEFRNMMTNFISQRDKELWSNPEWKKKRIGKNHPRFGIKLSKETKQKISDGNKGKGRKNAPRDSNGKYTKTL